MYRINKVCIDLLLLLILPVSSLSAQVAIETIDGYPAIDLSALEPLGAVLSSAEAALRHESMRQQTPSNGSYLSPAGLTESGVGGSWNAKMSKKYQVMRSNLEMTSSWASAWKDCQEYDGQGGAAGTWRLPTEHELMMIWILHPQLNEKGGFNGFSGQLYSSATETGGGVWCVHFGNGYVLEVSKTNTQYVRCVRDL